MNCPSTPDFSRLTSVGLRLRATWYIDRGFVNLSLWSDDRCVQTFHLTPVEAGRLVSFLASALAEAVPRPIHGALVQTAPMSPEAVWRDAAAPRLSDRAVATRRELAGALTRAIALGRAKLGSRESS